MAPYGPLISRVLVPENLTSPLELANQCTVQTFKSCTSQPDVCQCLVVKTPIENISKAKHINGESKLRFSMPPCPGNWVAIGRAVVYYARAAQALSAGIKWRHCSVRHTVADRWRKTDPPFSGCFEYSSRATCSIRLVTHR